MRRNIVHEGAEQLTYEIRQIVAVAEDLQRLGVEITWENIGDPIAKGEKIPQWIKDIIIKLASEDKTYGYVATPGRCSVTPVSRRNGEYPWRLPGNQG
ncbi:MAG: hypothetical protein MZU95_14790 [Desulfomicrobium escambiense]|nr:hypothetical protein [Desulfomicrobium escambiense]